MPLKVTCNSCGASLTAPDSAIGKRAKCPKCGSQVEIPMPLEEDDALDALASPLDEPSEEEFPSEHTDAEERMPCRACGEMIMRSAVKCRFCGEIFDKSMAGMLGSSDQLRDYEWHKVRGGLANIYYGIGAIFLCFILIILGAAIGGALEDQRGGDPSGAVLVIFGLLGFGILGAAITIFIGQVRCASVPSISGARGFAVSSVLCTVASTLLSIVGNAADAPAFQGIGSLGSLVGNVLFLLFIRQTAKYLNEETIARSVMRLIVLGIAMFFGAFALGFLSAFSQEKESAALMGVIVIVVFIFAIVAFLWFVRLIKSLMDAIDARTGQA